MGDPARCRDGDLRVHQRLLQSAPQALSLGLEKPGRLRTESGLNEHLERHDYATGPISEKFTGIEWHGPFSLHDHNLYLTTLADMTAAEYLNSYPLDLNALSYARRFQK